MFFSRIFVGFCRIFVAEGLRKCWVGVSCLLL